MAEKRMFARKIIDSDAFLEMPLSAQALYFHLNMRADDDGFVNNPKRITDYVNASVDDLKILLTKRFVIGFESGVIVIRHWKIHNTIKSDRYRLTDYQEELARLLIEPSKAYSEAPLTPQLSPLHKTALHWLALHRAVHYRMRCGTQNAFPEGNGQTDAPGQATLWRWCGGWYCD